MCFQFFSVNSYFILCPDEQLSTVRELSIMSPKSPPVSMRFIPEQNDKEVLKRDTNESYDLLSQQPSRYFPPIMLHDPFLLCFYCFLFMISDV
jgi:hypothetical protein